MTVRCMSCGKIAEILEKFCKECGSTLEVVTESKYSDTMEKNFEYVDNWISLGEIVTPLLHLDQVDLKLDYFQPTFSYKDRGSKVAISALRGILQKKGITDLNEDSSGNAGSSFAAYGITAGFTINIFVPENTNRNKLEQIITYGAKVHRISGTRENVAEAAKNYPGFHMSHVLVPEFRDGIRSLAYEIFRQYDGKMPDRIFLPVSAGTLFLGLYAGLKHLLNSGEISEIPEIVCVQSDAISPICSALGTSEWIDRGQSSIADALVTRKSPLMEHVVERLKEAGTCISVSDSEIKESRNRLASAGILTEYSSATVYAAFSRKNYDGKNLLVLTGNGLKNI